MSWKRARNKEQVAVRLGEVVGACARLYGPHAFDRITMAAIAREAGWTRSNIYKYFRTREEIFLELLKLDLAAWRSDVVSRYAEGGGDLASFARSWLGLYLDHERMLGLMAILHTSIEPNCSVERLTAFRVDAMQQFARVATVLARALPFRDAAAVTDFLFAQFALLQGAYPMWNPSPRQKAAMEAAGMAAGPDYFQRVFTRSLEALLVAATGVPA
jgi:AcrR family transcriptional regulator